MNTFTSSLDSLESGLVSKIHATVHANAAQTRRLRVWIHKRPVI